MCARLDDSTIWSHSQQATAAPLNNNYSTVERPPFPPPNFTHQRVFAYCRHLIAGNDRFGAVWLFEWTARVLFGVQLADISLRERKFQWGLPGVMAVPMTGGQWAKTRIFHHHHCFEIQRQQLFDTN